MLTPRLKSLGVKSLEMARPIVSLLETLERTEDLCIFLSLLRAWKSD